MSTSLALNNVGSRVDWSYDSVLLWGNANNSSSFSKFQSFTQGTGAGNCNKIYIAQGTISPSGTLTLNLSTGLSDVFGNAIAMTGVKVYHVELTTDTTASNIIIGNAGTHPFGTTSPALFDAATDTISLYNGGVFSIVNPSALGYGVGSGAHDQILITNADGTNTATYRILIAGIG
jgi:hypothetical protein